MLAPMGLWSAAQARAVGTPPGDGIGRGISPYELGYHRVSAEDSRDIMIDAYQCLREALLNETFSYKGKYFEYADVPMPLRPLTQPHPAFWYGSSNATGSAYAGEQGMHFADNGPTAFAKGNIDAFRAALAKRGGAEQPKPEFAGGCAIGALRNIVVADTDAEALAIAEHAERVALGNRVAGGHQLRDALPRILRFQIDHRVEDAARDPFEHVRVVLREVGAREPDVGQTARPNPRIIL